MAGEIKYTDAGLTGETLYATVQKVSGGSYWNTSTSAYEAYNAAHWLNYAVALAEANPPAGDFAGNMPAAVPVGNPWVTAYRRLGASDATTDPIVADGFIAWAGPSAPADLVAAVIAWLRSYNGGSVATAFGDSTATPKFYGDKTLGSPATPWLRLTEVSEPLGAEAPESDGSVHYYGRGQLQLDVFDGTKSGARTLRKSVITALNDAALAFTDGTLLNIWPDGMLFPVTESVGPGTTTQYQATVTLTYFVDRTFT